MTNYFRISWSDLTFGAKEDIKKLVISRIKDDKKLMKEFKAEAEDYVKQTVTANKKKSWFDSKKEELIREEVKEQLKNLEIKGEV